MNKRIEYIDAMRGFTMLLVVYSHIQAIGYDTIYIPSINQALITFRMPLFFFISGYILYKASRIWDWNTTITFLKKKFKIQILPTIFFFTAYMVLFRLEFINSIFHENVLQGYWFTISLFEYFFIYSIYMFLLCNNKHKIIYGCFLSIFAYVLAKATNSPSINNIVTPELTNVLLLDKLKYYIFFFFGTITRQYIETFTKITDKKAFITFIILIFFFNILYLTKFISIFSNNNLIKALISNFIFITNGFSGIIITFTIFRKNADSFSESNKYAKYLQFIGRRTLDIYMLHYFFLPRHIDIIGKWFIQHPNPTIEFFFSMSLAILVVILSLSTSYILRLSPFLAHHLFGQKSTKK